MLNAKKWSVRRSKNDTNYAGKQWNASLVTPKAIAEWSVFTVAACVVHERKSDYSFSPKTVSASIASSETPKVSVNPRLRNCTTSVAEVCLTSESLQ